MTCINVLSPIRYAKLLILLQITRKKYRLVFVTEECKFCELEFVLCASKCMSAHIIQYVHSSRLKIC